MARVVFVGAYAYAERVLDSLPEPPMFVLTTSHAAPRQEHLYLRTDVPVFDVKGKGHEDALLRVAKPDLVVVAGWRRLVPVVAPTVGFHSAKLPDYPGRAPVANAILRGDPTLTNTMLWLTDSGVPDDGDIIDEWEFPLTEIDECGCCDRDRSPDEIYAEIGETSALMLRRHWQALFDGSAPRRPQDPSKRGPMTRADAWERIA
jgi:methionyl-tRNA formyltransferase